MEINIEELERFMIIRKRDIPAKLHITTGDRRERDITRRIVLENVWGIDNGSTTTLNINTIPRDQTIGERESKTFIKRQMSLLKTNNVMISDKMIKGIRNRKTAL